MKIAVENGFPPETINFAAEYYIKKQIDWEKEIILLKEERNSRIFRPTRRLFRLIKEQRGTETDLNDIRVFEEMVED